MATGTAIAGIIASAGIAPGPTPATTNPAIKTAIGISQTRLPEAATIFSATSFNAPVEFTIAKSSVIPTSVVNIELLIAP